MSSSSNNTKSEYSTISSSGTSKNLNNLKGQFGQWLVLDGLLRKGITTIDTPCLNDPDNHQGSDFIDQKNRILIEVKFFVNTGRYELTPDLYYNRFKKRFGGYPNSWKKTIIVIGNRLKNWYWVDRWCRRDSIRIYWVDVLHEKLKNLVDLLPLHGDRLDLDDSLYYVPSFRDLIDHIVSSIYLVTTPVYDKLSSVRFSVRVLLSVVASHHRRVCFGPGDPPGIWLKLL